MDLLENPFWILRATQWDDRQRIIELAADCEFRREDDACARARARLVNPRQRLSAEIAWLLGMRRHEIEVLQVELGVGPGGDAAPGREQLLPGLADGEEEQVTGGPVLQVPERLPSLPALPRANVLASLLVRRRGIDPARRVLHRVSYLVRTWAEVGAERVLADINEARRAAGFASVPGTEEVRRELAERQRWCAGVAFDSLRGTKGLNMVDAVTELASKLTDEGRRAAPALLVEIVESYELQVRRYLDDGYEAVQSLCEILVREAESGDSRRKSLEKKVGALEETLRAWDRRAQPIQLVMKSEGRVHEQSERLAHLVRNASVALWNKRQDAALASRLNRLLRDVFAEVDVVVDQLREDAKVLEELGKTKTANEVLEKLAEAAREAIEKTEKSPQDGAIHGRRLEEKGRSLIGQIRATGNGDLVRVGEDILAAALRAIAVETANRTERWSLALEILDLAEKYVHDPEMAAKIRKDITTVRSNIQALLTGAGSRPSPGADLLAKIVGKLIGYAIVIGGYFLTRL